MTKFLIQDEWSGYSRGYLVAEVEAETKEEAIELYHEGEYEEVERHTVRDDTERRQEPRVIS